MAVIMMTKKKSSEWAKENKRHLIKRNIIIDLPWTAVLYIIFLFSWFFVGHLHWMLRYCRQSQDVAEEWIYIYSNFNSFWCLLKDLIVSPVWWFMYFHDNVVDIILNGKYVNNNYLHEVHKSKNIMSTRCVFC